MVLKKYSKKMTPNDIACLFRTTGDDGKGIWVGLLKGQILTSGMDLETKTVHQIQKRYGIWALWLVETAKAL